MNRKRILKVVALIAALCAALMLFCGCEEHKTGNRVTYGKDVQTFTYAYINLGGQEIDKGYVTQWRDYNDSDTVQVLVNGKYYLTHYTNVVLIADPSQGALAYGDPDWVPGVAE